MTEFEISRRQLLGGAAAGAGGLALAACGGSSTHPSTTSTTANQGTPKRGGTFRFGTSDGSTADSVDSLLGDADNTNAVRNHALYDMLTRNNRVTGLPEPYLAEELEPAPDLSYWTVRVRPAEFHNGQPVTADDVMYTLRRVINPKSGAIDASLLAAVDPQRMQKLDNRTVRLHLHYPDIGIPYYFRDEGTAIVPVDYDPSHPIGSGPFKFKSFTPGQQSIFVRNDNYWQSGQPYLDELQIIDFADPTTARVNALVSGQIDGADRILPSLVPTVRAAPDLTVIVEPATEYHTYEMRMDIKPFNDVRMRQAIKLIANRSQIIEEAFSGTQYARLGNDWPSIQDPMYDRSIPQREQDLEQAKSLIKQAGYDGSTIELAVTTVTGVTQVAQVLAQNAQGTGLTIKVNNIPDQATYFAKYYAQAPFKFDLFFMTSVWEHIGYSLLPGAVVNLSNWNDPQWLKIVREAQGTVDVAKRKELMGEAQKIFWDIGTQAVFYFYSSVDVHNAKFTGFQPTITSEGLNQLYFNDISLA